MPIDAVGEVLHILLFAMSIAEDGVVNLYSITAASEPA
jgi:hypothetical protein